MASLRAGLSTMLLALALSAGDALAQSEGEQSQENAQATAEAQAPAPPPPVDPDAPPSIESPECSWIGQRILMLLWRDDIDTAKDFIEIYDRFGCPMGHEAPAFRCLVQIGVNPEEADPGLPERAKACWQDPALDPAAFLQPKSEEAPAQQ